MSSFIRDLGRAVEQRAKGETLRVEPWGADSVRVRAAPGVAPCPLFPRDGAHLPVREGHS
jgi:hypothetical protein